MVRLNQYIARRLSLRISLKVVLAIATLLIAALFIMFQRARDAVKEEALRKAGQTLDGAVWNIDNILLSVEQTAGNIYYDMLMHPGQPERLQQYCRELVETNPYISASAIATDDAYYHYQAKDFEKDYKEQTWYRKPMDEGRPCWTDPLTALDGIGSVISFCLPIYGAEGRTKGVMGMDVPLKLLSKIVLAAKPSPNSYATLLGSDGSYIVHPDSTRLLHQTVFTMYPEEQSDAREVAAEMMAGQTGYRQLRINGTDSYVFYKPFKRSAVQGRSIGKDRWSIGIVYPEDDIFDDYNQLLYVVLIIALVGLVLLLIGCQAVSHRQLAPLQMLSRKAQLIAEGDYDATIPDSRQQDEVGRLQDHFQQMQQALALHVRQLGALTDELRCQGETLKTAYERAKEDDRVKTAFLHKMSNQMVSGAERIKDCVDEMLEHTHETDHQETGRYVEKIEQQGHDVTELLNHLLAEAQEKTREEGAV